MQIAFNTEQDIQFLRWLKTTNHTATMINVDAGWTPDYETGVYYAWFTWELDEHVLEEYVHSIPHRVPEQLTLDLDYTLCNISRTVRFP